MEHSDLRAALHHKTVIGITGHRDLFPEMEDALKAKLSEKLKELSKQNVESALLTSLASGADQLAAEAAIDAGMPVIVLLPMKKAYYENDFKPGIERTKFNDLLARNLQIITIDDTAIEKLGDLRNIQYETAGRLIAACSDHLIALWDGVYTGECGGTSEIVRITLGGSMPTGPHLSSFNIKRKQPAFLHHLLTPRQRNPFPVSDPKISFFPLKEMEWGKVAHPLPQVKQPGKFRRWYGRYKEFMLKFIIPLLLVLVTLRCGYIGFCELEPEPNEKKYNRLNAFYSSVNLITLNTLVLSNNQEKIPWQLQIARVTGLLTATYAVLGAFLWAASSLRKRAAIFLWGRKFYLVIGLNEKSFNLVKDLLSHKRKTVVLNDDASSPFTTGCENLGAIVYKGNPSELSDLNYVYFKKAKNIYVFTDSDTENVRIMQAIDEHIVQDNKKYNSEFYVHINDLKQKEFLARTTRSDVSIFNIYENAVRRLLIKHPLDRFQYNFYNSPNKRSVQVIILGFDKIAWELAMAVLRMGHYTNDVSLELLIFTEGAEQQTQSESFREKYGRIFRNAGSTDNNLNFLQQASAKVEFKMLPGSDAALIDPENSPIFQCINISNDASISIFTCLANSLKSAACLSLLLPRLDYLKGKHSLNMQVFCCYNSPDEIEEAYIEYKMNKIGTNIPIYCFGNFLTTCTEDVIKNSTTDQLAKQLAFWYYLIYSFNDDTSELSREIRETYNEEILSVKKKDFVRWMEEMVSEIQKEGTPIETRIKKAIELFEVFWKKESVHAVKDWWNKCWLLLTENDKESNRQAADHIFVKLRCIGKSPVEVKSIVDMGVSNIELLSSIEHRRWCAEKFIDGWHLFDDKNEWLKKGQKTILKKQKLHYDLRDFESLDGDEKNKDHNQVIGIPYFLAALLAQPNK